MTFASNPVTKYNCYLETVFCSILSEKQHFAKFSPFVAENCVLHQIELFLKNCVLLFGLKTAFYQN